MPCLLCTALVYGEEVKGVMVSTVQLHGCSAEKTRDLGIFVPSRTSNLLAPVIALVSHKQIHT